MRPGLWWGEGGGLGSNALNVPLIDLSRIDDHKIFLWNYKFSNPQVYLNHTNYIHCVPLTCKGVNRPSVKRQRQIGFHWNAL